MDASRTLCWSGLERLFNKVVQRKLPVAVIYNIPFFYIIGQMFSERQRCKKKRSRASIFSHTSERQKAKPYLCVAIVSRRACSALRMLKLLEVRVVCADRARDRIFTLSRIVPRAHVRPRHQGRQTATRPSFVSLFIEKVGEEAHNKTQMP